MLWPDITSKSNTLVSPPTLSSAGSIRFTISPFFEHHFARLGYFGPDRFNLWARRHNDEWIVLGDELTLQGCFDEMRANPWFHF